MDILINVLNSKRTQDDKDNDAQTTHRLSCSCVNAVYKIAKGLCKIRATQRECMNTMDEFYNTISEVAGDFEKSMAKVTNNDV